MTVPYVARLFPLLLESHLLPQRGSTELDINDSKTLVYVQKTEQQWAEETVVISNAEGGRQMGLQVSASQS